MNDIYARILALIIMVMALSPAHAQDMPPTKDQVGIDEKLDSYVPMDAVFTSSDGQKVTLRDVIKRPTVLSLVYYDCPGICTPLLEGLAEVVEQTDMIPGEDYDILTVSFDHRETPELAAKWKEQHLKGLKREIRPGAWKFFTGDSASVKRLTNAVGFYFMEKKPLPGGRRDILHGAALIVLAPDGKITRYHLGTEFLPFNLKMSLIEAGRGESRPTMNAILDLCFKYDATGRKYTFNILAVVGTVMLVVLAGFVAWLVLSGRKTKIKENI